jgi:electron transfer flavoprotein alpha subunit/transcriptional regulator with XRE-family HTH domain
VYVDLRNERLFGLSLKVLGKARELAEAVEGKTAAVMMEGVAAETASAGPHADRLEAEAAGESCVAHGADRVYALTRPELGAPRSDNHAAALAELIGKRSPGLVLFALTDLGLETAARTARILGAGLIADCIDLRIEKESPLKSLPKDDIAGRVVATCAAWGGEVMAEIAYAAGQKTGLATMRPLGLRAKEIRGEPGAVERVTVDGFAAPAGLRFLSSAAEPEEHRRLEEAEVVVVGGAGLASADGFGLARELATALGAEVGATRPAVLAHWTEEERLIGQTGKTVRPRLLVSAGTSGAVQYTAGIVESGTIVAVNRDPDAPIFHVADLGVVADAKTFLPALTRKVKQARMRALADMVCAEADIATKVAPPDEGGGLGEKVRGLREAQGWSREEMAERTGQTPEFISQVEADEVTPSVAFLLRLAKALKVDPAAFLSESEKSAMRDQRSRAFVKRTQNYSYQTLTPGAEHEHLRAFMIVIEPKQAHKPVAYKHEGEEFVYVMEGELELTVGAKLHHLKPGESHHFNSEIPHKLKSLSDQETRCLVMLYTP